VRNLKAKKVEDSGLFEHQFTTLAFYQIF